MGSFSLILLALLSYFVFGSTLKVGLIRHVQSQYNYDSGKLLEKANSDSSAGGAKKYVAKKLGSLAHTGDKDSPVSGNGLGELRLIYQNFGAKTLKELGMDKLTNEDYKIVFEASDLRRALWTAIAARQSMIDATSNEKVKAVLTNPERHFSIQQNLRETLDGIHRDSVSKYQFEWRQTKFPFKGDAKAHTSFLNYLAEGLPAGTPLLSSMGVKDLKFMSEDIAGIEWSYVGKNKNMNGFGDDGKLGLPDEIKDYAKHLVNEKTMMNTNVIIAGAHSKWIQAFVAEYGNTEVYEGLKGIGKDKKVPNGAVLWMDIEILKKGDKPINIKSMRISLPTDTEAVGITARESDFGDLDDDYYGDGVDLDNEDYDEDDDGVATYLKWFG